MSQSIYDLLGRRDTKPISVVTGVKQPSSFTLFNTDNPEMGKKRDDYTVAGSIEHKKRIKDMYYNSMKLKNGHPRNGSGYSYDKYNGRLPNFKASIDFFYSDGSIDPNQIRQQYDPENALPDDYVQGTLYDSIVLPDGAYISSDSINLLNQSKESYERYKSNFGDMSLDAK